MLLTIFAHIQGKLVAIEVRISTNTKLIDGIDYHLVEHQNEGGFRYLATSDAIEKLKKDSQDANVAMEELATEEGF